MNIVINGHSGSGKSTAIRRILCALQETPYGFWTEKLPFGSNAPVYLHPCRLPLAYTEENRIGFCRECHAQAEPAVFESVGVAALSDIPRGALVLMDEVGVMERDAAEFQRAVFRILDGDYRVLVAVRDRSTPLLDAIRSHPKSLLADAPEANTPDFLAKALRLFTQTRDAMQE